MTVRKIAGLVLVALGLLALVYGGFSYTKETHSTKVGPVELSVKEKERVNVPVWVGAAAVIAGAVVLVADRRRR